MTSHQFAKLLLEQPDMPILVPKVKEYSDDEDDCCAAPSVWKNVGYSNETDSPVDVLVISYREDGGGRSYVPNRERKSANDRISDGASVEKQ